MPELPPIDVDRALTRLGLVAVGGTGTAGGWLARRPEDEAASTELLVVPAPLDDRLSARVALFSGVRHEHLGMVRGVTTVDAGRTGVLVDHVRGATLATIRRARAPLTDGECATLLVPLADALAALAAAGLAHGAVDADHVVVEPDGRPMLVGPRPGLLGSALGDDDLPRLLSTVVDVMPEEDGALLAEPSPVPRLRPVLELLLSEGATASDVVDRCYATVVPEALRLPDPATLAATSLVAAGGRPFPVAGRAVAVALPRPRATTLPGRRRAAVPRHRRGRRAGVVALAALLSLLVVLVLGGPVRRLAGAGAAGADGRPVADAVLDRSRPAEAAAELTRRRAVVIQAGEPSRLSEVAVAGGPSATADTDVLRSLDGHRVEGLSAVVDKADVVGTPAADRAEVLVTASTSRYVTVGDDGIEHAVAATPSRTTLLHLRWTVDGWRVWSVSEPTAAS